jgi:hypothetical protein
MKGRWRGGGWGGGKGRVGRGVEGGVEGGGEALIFRSFSFFLSLLCSSSSKSIFLFFLPNTVSITGSEPSKSSSLIILNTENCNKF